MNDLIRALVEAHGPSGFEDQVREIIRSEVADLVDDLTVDAMGNLIAHRRGSGQPDRGLKVMIAAHMDEIGLMVTHVTAGGFLRFTNIGGIQARNLEGNRVQFANGTVGIVFGEPNDSRLKVHPLSKHFIDVGASGPDNCPVAVGDAASFQRPLLAQGKLLTAKSMDDRIGCAVAIEALRRLGETPHDLYVVFSVQEEIGVRGAQAAANAIRPDVGLALDVTLTGDTPEARTMAIELGAGPAIKVRDSGMIAHAGLVQLMKQRAAALDLAYQLEVLDGGSTDARAMQIAGPGCAAGCISVPCRYVHSQSETVHSDDVRGAVELLAGLLADPLAELAPA